MSATGRWVRNESPQSPCTKSPSQLHVLRRARLVEVVLVLEVVRASLRDAGPVAQVLQRVATSRDQREHDDRREEDDDQCGHQAPHDERDHRKFLAERSCGDRGKRGAGSYGV